jgi:putative membrane protein insertion efficiency factor
VTGRPLAPAPGHVRVALAVALHRAYKVLISPLFAGSCRFEPSCADYMRDALIAHGTVRGAWLGLRRLARCHPFGGHGYDPVPTADRPHRDRS